MTDNKKYIVKFYSGVSNSVERGVRYYTARGKNITFTPEKAKVFCSIEDAMKIVKIIEKSSWWTDAEVVEI